MSELENNITALVLLLNLRRKRRQQDEMVQRKKRRWWVRPINRQREKNGEFRRIMLELKLHDEEWFFTYTRMSPTLFDNLLSIVGPELIKNSIRTPLEPSQRLAITLRHLATGDSSFSIANSYHIGRSTVCVVTQEVRKVIWNKLSGVVLKYPSKEEYKDIASTFYSKWQMPFCLGSIDGKHIRIKCPPKSGSLYFNYKKYFSIILLGICDAEYNFLLVDIGAYGSVSDGGVLSESEFGEALYSNTLNIPEEDILPGSKETCNYFFIGDAAFPLHINLMRPYAGHNLNIVQNVFNYRLSRARRIIENTFGILAARWRIFLRTLEASPENVDDIIKATVCLHNFIRRSLPEREKYTPTNYVDSDDMPGTWRQEIDNCIFTPCNRLGSNNPTIKAQIMREKLSKFFVSKEGFLKGQIEYVKRI